MSGRRKPSTTMVDPDRIQQVIRNLLSQRRKVLAGVGVVCVRLRRVGRAVLLSVRDEGPGIPPDEVEAVFDKFVQSSKTKSNKGGTGWVWPFAARSSADIRAESGPRTMLGQGASSMSSFPLRIPIPWTPSLC